MVFMYHRHPPPPFGFNNNAVKLFSLMPLQRRSVPSPHGLLLEISQYFYITHDMTKLGEKVAFISSPPSF